MGGGGGGGLGGGGSGVQKIAKIFKPFFFFSICSLRLATFLLYKTVLTLLLLNTTCPVLANSVDPDQL